MSPLHVQILTQPHIHPSHTYVRRALPSPPPASFVRPGFTPPDKLDRVKSSGLTEGLAFAFRQLNKGGGAKKLRENVKNELLERYGAGLTDEEIRAKVSGWGVGLSRVLLFPCLSPPPLSLTHRPVPCTCPASIHASRHEQ